MRLFRILVLLVGIAVVASSAADGRQIRGLLKKAKKKAEEQVELRAQQELDRQVEKMVNALWDEAADNFSDMLMNAMPKAKTSVDLEKGIIKREGQPDLDIKSNARGPIDAEYVQYLQVSTMNLPSQLAKLGDIFGNAVAETVLLHGDKKLSEDDTHGTLTDLDAERYVFLNHEQKEYWSQGFGEMFDMAASAMGNMKTGMEEMPEPTPAAADDDQPSYEMEANVTMNKGRKKTVRGIQAQQHIVIVETVAKSEETAEAKGKFYVVMEIWTAEEFGGSETLAAFNARAGELMLEAMAGSDLNAKLDFSAFGDPRMGESMKKATDKFSEIKGFPIETNSFFVTGPIDEELDLDAVLEAIDEADVTAFAGVSSEEPVKVQTTMFSTTTFIANLTTDEFDLSLLGTRDYTEIESPMKQFQEIDGD